MRITVAITGASGAIYAHHLLLALEASREVSKVYVVMSKSGEQVWSHELPDTPLPTNSELIEVLSNDSFFESIASGSNCADAMVIAPCSMGTLGRIASGVSSTLLERAADVQLKERMPLIVVPRESPLSLIHLQNMTALCQAGATILPASPSFYSHPKSLDDVVLTTVERVLDKIGVKNNKNYRWNKK